MTEQENYLLDDTEEEESIDFLKLGKKLWVGRKTLSIYISIGLALGVFIALFAPNTYTVTTIIVPQMANSSSSKLGGLSSLAALAGIDLNTSAGSDMSPIVYPQIVSSVPFQLELMNAPLNFSDVDHPVSMYDYYTNYYKPSVLGYAKKYTIGLPGLLIKAIKGKKEGLTLPKSNEKQPIYVTDDQYQIKLILDDAVVLDAAPKDGYLSLTVQMPEALAAAQLAQKAMEILQRDITNFKIEKAKADLDFIQGRYEIAKAEAEGYQLHLAQKSDQFKSLTSAVPQVQSDRIQTRYNVANNVYMEMAKQLEMAKIQVKKDTPVFTVVQPATIPSEKSGPNRPIIIIVFIFLSGIVGSFIVLGKPVIINLRKRWNQV
ncbi:MAG: Wzz/FepE/Etk N-terminal domain-containing protein [Paludibacter sp.]|nr:Wzz/FepE/Etk N-terminal domain-containing protein [Paludibacter sp.]